jgi:hypothetical protein
MSWGALGDALMTGAGVYQHQQDQQRQAALLRQRQEFELLLEQVKLDNSQKLADKNYERALAVENVKAGHAGGAALVKAADEYGADVAEKTPPGTMDANDPAVRAMQGSQAGRFLLQPSPTLPSRQGRGFASLVGAVDPQADLSVADSPSQIDPTHVQKLPTAKQSLMDRFVQRLPPERRSAAQSSLFADALGLKPLPETTFESDAARATREATKLTDARALAEAQAQGRAAGTPDKPEKPTRERLVQVMGPDGTAIWTPESQATGKPAAHAPRAVTGLERQALAFYNRARSASEDIEPLEDEISKLSLAGQSRMEFAPNFLQSQTGQLYRQAQRAFTEARLRKESGAVINDKEYEKDAMTYFAQPGDTPTTMDQKRKARQVVMDGLKFSAGRAFDEFYGGENRSASDTGGSSFKVVGSRPAGK